MKRIYTSLLVALMALLGLPVTAQTVTTYDFEDGNAMFTADSRISVTVVEGKQTIYSTDFTPDGKAVKFTGAGNAQNGYSFAHFDFSSLCDQAAKVKVEFEAVLGNGARSRISIGDASVRGNGSAICSKTTYGAKGAIFMIGTEKSVGYLNGTNNSGLLTELTQKWLKVTVEVDELAKTYTYSIVDKATDAVLYDNGETPISFWQSDATNCTQIDMFGYINNAQMGLIDNLVITVTKDERQQANYTVNFLDKDSQPIKEAVTRNGAVGAPITLLPADKDPLWNAEGTQKYIYQSDDTEGLTIAEDGSTVVNITYRDAAVYNYTVVSNLGANLASGTGFEGENLRVGYPRYQLVDNNLYMANVDNKEYRTTVSLTADNVSNTVNYTLQEGKVAVFYTEAENIEGITIATNDNIPVRASGAVAATTAEDILITNIPNGKYKFHVGIFTSKSSYDGFAVNFGIGTETFAAAFSAVNLNEVVSEEYELNSASTPIKYLASSSADTQFDYIWIEKTGDAELAFDPATLIANADFEGEYTVSSNPSADRAIYQPAGWTLTYENGEANDMTALNSECLAWNSFSGKPQPTNGGNNTYWIRFRWGSNESLTLSQIVKLPAGDYKLSADAFFNGANGGSATISAAGQSTAITGNSVWANHSVTFSLAEETEVTIAFNLTQTSQVENIAAFDNFTLTTYDPLADAKETLQAEITAAEALVANATLADGKEELNAAITAAKKALAEATTAEQLSTAVETLKAAEAAFNKAQAIAANAALVAGASIENPVEAPFVVNGTFDSNDMSAWKATGGFQNNTRKTTDDANAGIMNNSKPWYENWNKDAKVNKMSQVIDNIPNGVYKLNITAFVNNLQDPNESQFVFANADQILLTEKAANYEVYTKVENNTLEVGLEQTVATANWMGIDNVALLYFGTEGTVEDAKMAAPKNNWKIAKAAAEAALYNEDYANVTGSEKSALEAEIAKAEPASSEAYVAATEALTSATGTFVAAKDAYDTFVSYNKTLDYADAAKKPVVTNETTAATIIAALRAYYESNANAEGVEGAEVIASAIQNPRAEAGTNGWTATGNGSIGIKDGTAGKEEPWTDAEGNSAYKYFDGGNWGANAWDVNFAQDITLGAGKYVLSAIMRASTNVDMKLFAGTDSVKAEVVGSAGNVFNRGWNYSFVEFEVAAEGTVNIGVRGVTSNVHEWMSFSDFRLVRIEKPAAPEFEPKYGTLWTEEDGYEVTEEPEPFNKIVLDNKYFNGLVKVGDTLRVSISKVGNVDGARSLIIDKGTLNLFIGNDGDSKTIQYGTTSADFVLDENEVAMLQETADVILTWKNLTLAQVELLEHKAEIDPTLLAEAEGLASDASAVAVGKLLAAIETYKKDGKAETLQAAIDQFKADNADQEADQTAKVATNGWKKFDGSNAGVCSTQFAPAITTYDGRTANLAEVYENNGNRTGTIIYQDITGLTNGKYKVGFYGNAFSTSVRDGFECTMEDGATDVAYVFANEEKAYITARIATSTTENDFRQFDVEVTDGVIKLGMGKDTEKSTNWHTMQIYQLTWFTTAKELFAAAQVDLKATIAAAEALKTDYRTEGLDAFNDAIALAKQGVESNWYNISEIQSMISELKDAMEAFKVANYYKFNDNLVAYVIDAETGKSIAAGHDWGTRGIVNEAGLDLTFETTDNNKVFLNTQVSNGGNSHYLGDNLYMDGAAYAWAFEYVGFGFYITNGTQYISLDAEDNLVLSDTPREWIVVTAEGVKETRLAEMADATPENPVDATFLLQNPNFNRNDQRVAAWVVSEDCTNKNLNGGNDLNNCAESYHSTFTISQTITDAPKGTYELRAQGFYRQDEGVTEDAPVFFINDKTIEVPVKTGEEGSMSAASESFTAGLYNCEPILVFVEENGTLTVGVKATGANQWVIFDNFRLTYYGATNTVGITEVNTNAENSVKTIYNLNGQKVEKAKKGLYIINGKKTVVK